MASGVAGKKVPIERDGWEKWYENNLPDLKDRLEPEGKFEEFGYKLSVLVDRLQDGYMKIETTLEPKRHRKRTANALKKISAALRERNLFKENKLPCFLTELLIKLCEYESSYYYSGGSRPQTVIETHFIAELANLLFEYTGEPFEYNRQDLLCKTASSCFVGLEKKSSCAAVVSQIKETIAVHGVQKIYSFSDPENCLSDATETCDARKKMQL